MPDLVQLAAEARRSGTPIVLREVGNDVAVH